MCHARCATAAQLSRHTPTCTASSRIPEMCRLRGTGWLPVTWVYVGSIPDSVSPCLLPRVLCTACDAGYTNATAKGLQQLNEKLAARGTTHWAKLVKVGVHEDVQVTSRRWGHELCADEAQTVTQVFTAACSIGALHARGYLWLFVNKYAQIVLKSRSVALALAAHQPHCQDPLGLPAWSILIVESPGGQRLFGAHAKNSAATASHDACRLQLRARATVGATGPHRPGSGLRGHAQRRSRQHAPSRR